MHSYIIYIFRKLMEKDKSILSKMGESTLKHILIFFTYSEIIDLFLVSWEFAQVSKDDSFYQMLLEDHFGVPKTKKGDFRQYYIALKTIIGKVRDMIKINKPNHLFQSSEFQTKLYPVMKKIQKQYEKTDFDLRFLMIRSLSDKDQNRYVFGGIIYYNFQQFYLTFKLDELSTQDWALFPQIMLQNLLVVADFDNKIGLGNRQRFIALDQNQQELFLVKWNQNPLKKTIQKKGSKYNDYFETYTNPKSDCTTNGIRIRTDSRLILNDPRFKIHEPFFSYQIRFSDNGASQKGANLLMRKWIIRSFSATGQEIVDTVQGQGVIGYYPCIKKGCEDFIYQSCCSVRGIRGIMEGHFQFQDISTKEKFNVIVKPFELQYGPNVAYSLKKQTGQVKKLV